MVGVVTTGEMFVLNSITTAIGSYNRPIVGFNIKETVARIVEDGYDDVDALRSITAEDSGRRAASMFSGNARLWSLVHDSLCKSTKNTDEIKVFYY